MCSCSAIAGGLPVHDEHLLHTAAVTAVVQAAVALLLPPLADAELFGEAVEEYFVRDAGEVRDQAAAAQLKEQAGALKAQAGAAQDVPAAVAKLQQAWPLPEALVALRLALQEPPAESLEGADTAKEQQVPPKHMQAAGPAAQEPPAQHLPAAGPAPQEPPAQHMQAAGPAPQEQRQMHAKHLQITGPIDQDLQEPPAGSPHGAEAVASSRQQAQLGRPPTDAPLAHHPSGGDEQLGQEQQQRPVHQSAPQQALSGEQQGTEEETASSSIPNTLQLVCQDQVALPEAPAGCTQSDDPQHAAHAQLTPAGDSAAKAAAQEQPAGAAPEAGVPAVPANQTRHKGLVEAQGVLAVASRDSAESDDMPRAPRATCNSTPGSAQVGNTLCKLPARHRPFQDLMSGWCPTDAACLKQLLASICLLCLCRNGLVSASDQYLTADTDAVHNVMVHKAAFMLQVFSAAVTVGALLNDLEATTEVAGAEMPDAKMPAAGGDHVWKASGTVREGSGPQVGLGSCVLASANLFTGMSMPTWQRHASAMSLHSNSTCASASLRLYSSCGCRTGRLTLMPLMSAWLLLDSRCPQTRGKLLREPQWRCLLHQGMLAAAGQHLMKRSQAQGEHRQLEMLRRQQSPLQLSRHCLAA